MAPPLAILAWAAARKAVVWGVRTYASKQAGKKLVKEAVELALDQIKDQAVDKFLEKAQKLATEKLLKSAADKGVCKACTMADVAKMNKPCDALKKGSKNGFGKYRGGDHNSQTGVSSNKPKDGKKYESHHIPPASLYNANKKPTRGRMPAIVMEKADHKCTPSHSHFVSRCQRFNDLGPFARTARGLFRKSYDLIQKEAIKEGGMMAGYALEAGMLMALYPGKYDEALKEAGAYAMCISMFPKKYNLPEKDSKNKKRK
jgi:hypothetical protein